MTSTQPTAPAALTIDLGLCEYREGNATKGYVFQVHGSARQGALSKGLLIKGERLADRALAKASALAKAQEYKAAKLAAGTI